MSTPPGGTPPVRWAFLDRDGTINVAPAPGEYLLEPDQVELLPDAGAAIRALNAAGVWTAVVTNQRAIARGEISERDLRAIHDRLIDELAREGAHLDAIYHCPHELGACSCRKPLPGMLLRARRRHPGLRFTEAVIVGDSGSDMEAGRRAGVQTVLLAARGGADERQADHVAQTLLEAVEHLRSTRGFSRSPHVAAT